MMRRVESKPRYLRFRSSTALISATVAVAVFTDLFLYGIIVPVIPTVLEIRVGLAPDSRQNWTSALLAIYAAGLLIASPIFGCIADRTRGRRIPLLSGLVVFIAATALLCIGTSIGLWVAGRLFQGISAAVVWTVSIALLVDTVPIDQLGKSMGIVGLAVSLGTLLGPLLGGVLYQHGGYYAVFGVAFGVLGIDLILRLTIVEKRYAQKWMDGGIPVNTSEPQSHGHDNDAPSRPPLLVLIRSGRMAIALYTYFVIASLMTAFDSVLPLFVEQVFGWGQTGQGLIFLPFFLPHLLEPLSGMALDRCPAMGKFMVAAALLLVTPFLVCLRLVTDNTLEQKALLCALLALIGTCVATGVPPLLAEFSYIIETVQRDNPGIFGKYGATAQGYGLSNAAFAAGGLVGPVWAGMIRDRYGWETMGWSLAALTGVSSLPVLLCFGGRLRRE